MLSFTNLLSSAVFVREGGQPMDITLYSVSTTVIRARFHLGMII
jgi:hypothetical protein